MCIVCSTFNPFLDHCEYDGLLEAPSVSAGAGQPPVSAPSGELTTEVGDTLASTATAAVMEVGGAFHGTLDTQADADWVAVDLVAGQQYTVALTGTDALGASNDDPYLRLRDAAGALIGEDDDGGPGRYSNYTFTAASTGTYYVDVQSWSNSDSGSYGVSVTEGDTANYSAEMIAGALLRPDSAWTSAPGTGATVSWAIRATGTEPDGGNTLVAPSAAQVSGIEDAMSYLAGISGLTLNQVNPGGTSDNATILFGSYSANDGRGAYAYYPGSTFSSSNSGDVWLNNNAVSSSNLDFGSYSAFVLLHEIGHAIGLAHPGDYDAVGGGSITYSNSAQFIQDSHQYTLMSYFNETATGASSGLGYPDTFMLFDILAIHQLYGVDTSFHSGDTVYGFNSNLANTAYDFDANSDPLMSIYDGAGADLIDLSGYTMSQYLDLGEGNFSNIGGYTGNLSIAYGAVIEDAKGGTGSDTILGNDAGNAIEGLTGNDSISGGGGADSLRGGEGSDTMSGGLENDRLWGEFGSDDMSGGDGDDFLSGHRGHDTLSGGAGDDLMGGAAGHDLMDGGDGADTLFGGTGRDRLDGGAGNDSIEGNNGNDKLWGRDGSDVIKGGDGNDLLSGWRGHDSLYGEAGNDTIGAASGDDVIDGGDGSDRLLGGSGRDTLTGGDGADAFVFALGGGQDLVTDFEDGTDLIELAVTGLGFGDLTISNGAGGAEVDYGAGNLITLAGITDSQLTESDFLFA